MGKRKSNHQVVKNDEQQGGHWSPMDALARFIGTLLVELPAAGAALIVFNFLHTIEKVVPYWTVWAVPLAIIVFVTLGFIVNELLLIMYGPEYFKQDDGK